MLDPESLEKSFRSFTDNISSFLPDGITEVNLLWLKELGLLNTADMEELSEESMMHAFHVTESEEKVTLFNTQFAVWIVPQLVEQIPTTLTFLATLPPKGEPHLEIVYATTGVYNAPHLILKILGKLLSEVKETETIISSIENKKP